MAKNDRFIVLSLGGEDAGAPTRDFSPGPRRAARGPAPAARPKLGVEVKPLAGKDRERIEASPKHFSARPMPIKLIRPASRAKGKVAKKAAPSEWGVTAVGADRSARTGKGVVVAVLDTGIAKDFKAHPAFKGIDVVLRNFTKEAAHDTDGHGTHCAGTIFGRAVDGRRIGVAPGVERVLIGKVLGDEGGSTEWIVQAIQWAVDEGAHVISMSLGIDFPGMVEELRKLGLPGPRATSEALAAYRDTVRLFDKLSGFVQARAGFGGGSGVLLVGAAGNESERPKFTIDCAPPAKAEGILPVAAVSQQSEIASFSNTGALVCGPGVDIVSAAPGGGLDSMSGTSMAAPHVAGVAALWAEELMATGQFGNVGLQSKVVGGAKQIAGLDFTAVGHGLVQAP